MRLTSQTIFAHIGASSVRVNLLPYVLPYAHNFYMDFYSYAPFGVPPAGALGLYRNGVRLGGAKLHATIPNETFDRLATLY